MNFVVSSEGIAYSKFNCTALLNSLNVYSTHLTASMAASSPSSAESHVAINTLTQQLYLLELVKQFTSIWAGAIPKISSQMKKQILGGHGSWSQHCGN